MSYFAKTTIVTDPASPSTDAFGRFRMSEPKVLFDSKQLYTYEPLQWDHDSTDTELTLVYDGSNEASTTLAATSPNVSGGIATRQTKRRFSYQPGKSQLILMTGVLAVEAGASTVYRRIGYFDDDNGLFFEEQNNVVSVVVRSKASGSVVNTKTASTSWNIDQMDGTGPSGITADWSKTQIFVIDFEWLGVGRVRFGLNIDGITYYVHESLHANSLAVVYMSTPNLPLRYQLEQDPSGAAASMVAICATVASEGGQDATGTLHSVSNGSTVVDANSDGTIYALVGIALQSDRLGTQVDITSISVMEIVGSKNMEWMLLLNPTVAGTFTYSSVSNSNAESATGSSTNTVTGGTRLAGGYFSSALKGSASAAELQNAVRLGATYDGVTDKIVLCARPVGSTNADVLGTINWRELA